MEPREVFGVRLRQSREALGLSLRGLQDRMQDAVTYAQLSKYEHGLAVPSSQVLLSLCNALSCSPDVLFRPMKANVSAIEFRKKTRLSRASEKAVRAILQRQVDRYFELEEIVGVASGQLAPSPTTIGDPASAESVAAYVRQQWRLGDAPLTNVVHLLEERYVKVQQIGADAGFDGCSGWGVFGGGRFPIVVLAEGLDSDRARKRFTAAHELGHLLMDVSALPPKRAEAAAHRFAGAFLLPPDAVYAQVGKRRRNVEWGELAVIKAEYGISMAAALRRLFDLGVITDAVYRAMNVSRSAMGWRVDEPHPYAGTEQCFRFRQLLYRGLAEGKLSLPKAAELAGTTVDDLQAEIPVLGAKDTL